MAVSPSPWDLARKAGGWTLQPANTAAPAQGAAASQARGWLGGGFHLPGEGKKGKRLHVNAGKYSYFSFSFILKRPWC